MIDRYVTKQMKPIWTDQNRFQAWLEVEIAAVEGWSKLGEIPAEDAKLIAQNAKFDVSEIAEIEKQTKHDVVAFTRDVSRYLGPERKWVHFGLTSTDVVDTAYGYLMKQANDIIREDLNEFLEVVKQKALKYKDTPMIGRTHGVHAEPTTFGLVLANWYSEIKRDIERFDHAAKGVEAGKISGAVGSYANVPTSVEKFVCDKLGIRAQEISTQVLPRDLHAEYIQTMALIATSIERFALEVRHLQRTEVREAEEFFAAGQKGSSAMPHKRNPIGSENVTGLARVIRGHAFTALEDVPLWHERDISHSSAERVIIPDTTELLDYILRRFTKITKDLTVFPDKMIEDMNITHGLIYSQRVLLKLVEAGYSREQAYDIVQPMTAKAWDEKKDFRTMLENDTRVTDKLSDADLDDAFDYHWHLRNVDEIFKRVGLE
ncbi:adenylosuccinate lyase [Companilactobacillus pabuli]|uniref:Adenylosuccinate lyase n=1 Tax=Companilactobacillus pabuli TaxID=2714036 RepID=A0A7L7KUE6_9LACO|nr:adenylosuccinate lyase [Companilactobacillus pabuli]AKP03317.1 adenylosuccinate lyase [Companilactobacillus farciminis]AKS51616.1 adenylosuccinate lyase [Companilactobacillus farciminis]MDG5112421.1 adenylosuccinate lyase [Companilactobacillus pabuli]QMT83397.1 adenylosuccinate lyase [Companilactobacillus pabuli]GAQ01247.1 adenylosuccinate lyase [Companilactobacillus farciminis]